MARHIQDLIASRRAVLGAFAGLPLLHLAGCASPGANAPASMSQAANFTPIAANNADTVTLPPGYSWRPLISWGDALFNDMPERANLETLTRAQQERSFGGHNDMLAAFAAEYAFPPPANADRMILCANNEYVSPELCFPGVQAPADFTREQIEAMLASIGVSVVEIARDGAGWRTVRHAPGAGRNRRITPFTPALFSGPAARHPWILTASQIVNDSEPRRAGDTAPEEAVRCGTAANCAGGLTPWGTYLTAEENFNGVFFGAPSDEAMHDGAYANDAQSFGYARGADLWRDKLPRQFLTSENPHGPSLYGWVVEIDPYTPDAAPKKRTALGRKKNECASTALAADGRVAVYMGDDQRGEHVYKFVSNGRFDPANRAANMDLLDDGKLYCAEFLENGGGRWIEIEVSAANAAAQAQGSPLRFTDQADVLVRARAAAGVLGATPMDRPEDIEAVCDANWRGLGSVLIACTNNSNHSPERPGNPRRDGAENNLTGHIVRIDEDGGDAAAVNFTWDVFVLAGDPNAEAPTSATRSGAPAHVSTEIGGAPTFTGDRFACPDNLFIDKTQRVWITTDGNDGVFGDCNDSVMVTPLNADGARPVKRFLTGPVGAEICGPLMAPDERAFFCAIQHPGGNDVSGEDYSDLRWGDAAQRPPSSFPDGGDAWPRSAVIVITRDDGGRIGD